jgi:BASS family bile acid:Na+ symporter
MLLPIALAVIMFGIGLRLDFSQFAEVFRQPKAILYGLFGQVVLLPSIAFFIAWFYPMSDHHKVGLLLLAACPGGTASNLVTMMVKGRTALSVSLTAFNSFVILFSIPLVLYLGSGSFLDEPLDVRVSPRDVLPEIGLVVLLPVFLGMLVRYFRSEQVKEWESYLRYVLPGILLLVFVWVWLQENTNGFESSFIPVIIPLLMLNVGGMMLGYATSLWIGIKPDGSSTIAIEMGLQNTALAIFLANAVLEKPALGLMAVLYAFFSFFSTWFVGWLMMRRTKKTTTFAP